MTIEVSVIIPSYNRYPLNLFTLYALENQAFDVSKMEVILIDDASTDMTPQLENIHPLFLYRYIRNKTCMGRSATRNIGLQLAKGRVIIFLDAEMIVDPNYIKNHYRHHLTDEPIVVIGRNHARLYTFLFPSFNSKQISELHDWADNNPLNSLLWQKVKQNISDIKEPMPLVRKEDITNITYLNSLSLPDWYISHVFTQLEDNFENSRLSWLAFFGSNLSVKKSIIDQAGPFDTTFTGWGLEDSEFAFRLYKTGAKFILDTNLYRYHQEHPVSDDKILEETKNMILFQQKFPIIDVCIKALNWVEIFDFKFMDKVLEDHYALCRSFPEQFTDFKDAILKMLQQIPILSSKNIKISNLLENSGLTYNIERKQQILSERDHLDSKREYKDLVHLFDLLIDM